MVRVTKMQRFCVWVTMRLPRVVITDSLTIVFALAFAALGLGTLLTLNQPSVFSDVARWAKLEWALTFMVGGVLHIAGVVKQSRLAERAGMALLAAGSITYAFALFSRGTAVSWVLGTVFVLFCLAYVIRIIASTAARVRRFQA